MGFINIIFVCIVLCGLQLCSARLREHEESCDNYKPGGYCRPDIDLICLDNVCTCKEMAFYDPERKACVALIGESCTPERTTTYYYNGGYGYGGTYYPTISRCPKDAVCAQKDPNKTPDLPDSMKGYEWMINSGNYQPNRCICKRGYYPDEDLDICHLAAGYNQTCSDELAKNGTICDALAGLACNKEGRCSCNKTEGVFYDHKTKRCVTKVGQNCTSSTFCEKNSMCSTTLEMMKSRYGGNYNYYGGMQRNVVQPARKRNDTTKRSAECTCQPGYTLNAAGKCTGSFSVACSIQNPCNEDKLLACVDGLCQCQAGSHQAFSKNSNSTCVLLPNSACKKDSGPKCSSNAICSDSGHCQCKPGYAESPSGKCMLSYEHECVMPDNRQQYYSQSFETQTKPNVTEECNFYQGLSCTGNKCECFDPQLKWDAKKKVCTAGENERCGSITMMRTSEFDYQQEPFYPSAYLSRRYYPGNFGYINSYFVTCAAGFTCTKNHQEVEGWRVCEKSK